MKTDLHFRLSGAAALIAAIGLHSQAIAQAPSSPQASGRLEEITVTARRQEESMQRTPVAVTAISGKLLDTLNVQDVTRLAQLAPNLVITQQTSSLNLSLIHI